MIEIYRSNCKGMNYYHLIDGLLHKLNLLCSPENERVQLIRGTHF